MAQGKSWLLEVTETLGDVHAVYSDLLIEAMKTLEVIELADNRLTDNERIAVQNLRFAIKRVAREFYCDNEECK